MRLDHKKTKAKNIQPDTWYFIPSERRYIYVDDVDNEKDTTTAYMELGINKNGLDEIALCFDNNEPVIEILESNSVTHIAEYLQDNQALRASTNMMAELADQIRSESEINKTEFDDIDFNTDTILGAHQFLLMGVMQSYFFLLNDMAQQGLINKADVEKIRLSMPEFPRK